MENENKWFTDEEVIKLNEIDDALERLEQEIKESQSQ